MRLIDAENLWKAITTRIEECCDLADLSEIIEKQPTIDAVPVVRCKDCRRCNREIAVGEWEGSCRYWNTHSVMLDDFCSRAKRKEE